MSSGIYSGRVTHTRLRPKQHRLNYGVFSLLIDLDEIPSLARRLRLLRFDRAGILSFRQSDHGEGAAVDLRSWVERKLAEAGIPGGGRIEILAYPRMFGYVFNPLSVFFCYTPDGRLTAILYEVANTYSERHTYVIPAEETALPGRGKVVRQSADKVFYVSPFLPTAGRYRFRIRPPGNEVGVGITLEDEDGVLLTAAFHGKRQPLTDGRLLRVLLTYPLMTIKVMAGIHWEALKLWRKGIRFRKHLPATERLGSSVGRADGAPSGR